MTEDVYTARPAIPDWHGQDWNGQHLIASREIATGKIHFPPIKNSSPLAAHYHRVALAQTASLYSFTIIYPNKKSGKAPFVLAYADFPGDVRVFGTLVVPEGTRPQIGQPLRTAFRVDAEGQMHYFFEPAV